MSYELHLGDCLEVMPTLPANSFDSIVCDPPYGLSFMGKAWDHGVPGVPFWEAALRVAKPGAMLLAFGGTRTFHRLTVAIEDAGWEIRDCLMWLYGSGFPKSMDIGKAIDKAAGAEREVIGDSGTGRKSQTGRNGSDTVRMWGNENGAAPVTAPATDAARTWDGWGTALKPAWEPVIMAMKPLDGTYANNALTHGVAGLNVDGCRIGTLETIQGFGSPRKSSGGILNKTDDPREPYEQNSNGRWPSNLLLDESTAALLDEQSGVSGGKYSPPKARSRERYFDERGDHTGMSNAPDNYGDTGGASRFYFCAKASSSERNEGLQGMEKRKVERIGQLPDGFVSSYGNVRNEPQPVRNFHPTVKPLELMRYLCRLTKTPFGGTVLDPFCGSGSTGCAALMEGRSFVGIEISEEYYSLAQKRLERASAQPFLLEVT